MLKTRIIPILLTDGRGNVVKPIKFQRPYRIVGSLMQHTRVMEKRNIDELIILDIEATNEGRLIDAERIKDYTKELYCPVTLGGGIKSLDDINRLLGAGADKVAIQRFYMSSPKKVEKAARKFGSQALTGIINIKEIDCIYWLCEDSNITDGGGFSAHEWAKEMEQCGIGEILLTDTQKDGTLDGYNIGLIENVAASVKIPVIVSGGCSSIEDMAAALRVGAHAVAAGSLFLYQDITPRQCAKELKAMGFNTRIE